MQVIFNQQPFTVRWRYVYTHLIDRQFSSRIYNLSLFQKNQIPVLVVTDVAARGLDIPIVNTVIHYDCPSSPKLFVHRTGRTARGGREGNTVVLV